jgi:hypothetical protein
LIECEEAEPPPNVVLPHDFCGISVGFLRRWQSGVTSTFWDRLTACQNDFQHVSKSLLQNVKIRVAGMKRRKSGT